MNHMKYVARYKCFITYYLILNRLTVPDSERLNQLVQCTVAHYSIPAKIGLGHTS